MTALLTAIEYHLGERIETNADLAAEHPEWDMPRLVAKLGVRQRCLAQAGETASDLAVRAAEKLFASGACTPGEIDFILFCTQTPDHLLPTTACALQTRLGIPTSAGALDFNLGCSGYIYGLSLARGLIESGQARAVLLLTGDTYSRLINPADRNVRLVFGDAAAATLIRAEAPGVTGAKMTAFTFGTDGTGAENLIVRNGGLRTRGCPVPGGDFLEMNGGEIFNFTLRVVAPLVEEVLHRAGLTLGAIDTVVHTRPMPTCSPTSAKNSASPRKNSPSPSPIAATPSPPPSPSPSANGARNRSGLSESAPSSSASASATRGAAACSPDQTRRRANSSPPRHPHSSSSGLRTCPCIAFTTCV